MDCQFESFPWKGEDIRVLMVFYTDAGHVYVHGVIVMRIRKGWVDWG